MFFVLFFKERLLTNPKTDWFLLSPNYEFWVGWGGSVFKHYQLFLYKSGHCVTCTMAVAVEMSACTAAA